MNREEVNHYLAYTVKDMMYGLGVTVALSITILRLFM